MSKKLNRNKGGVGEGIAARLLSEKGHKIIDRNHQTKYGEIDIISVDKDVIVFTEVKLKVGDEYGTPEEMIDKRKTLQIRRTAEFYLLRNQQLANQYELCRIDAVCIVLDKAGKIMRCNHYENIE